MQPVPVPVPVPASRHWWLEARAIVEQQYPDLSGYGWHPDGEPFSSCIEEALCALVQTSEDIEEVRWIFGPDEGQRVLAKQRDKLGLKGPTLTAMWDGINGRIGGSRRL